MFSSESVPKEVAELAEKYQFILKDERSIQKEVIELKKIIRSAVKKQMRIKAGYVQMQKATNGKKQSDYLKREVRDLSDQISDMQDDLQILDVYDTGAFDDEESRCDDPVMGGTGVPIDLAGEIDVNDGGGHHTLENSRLSALQKDLAKEMKVKDGLEKFMSSNTSASRRYLEDSKNMLDVSLSCTEAKSRLDIVIDDLLFRLWKEAAIIDGAKNMVKILRAQRKTDHRSLSDAQQTLILSEEKLDLIFMALNKYICINSLLGCVFEDIQLTAQSLLPATQHDAAFVGSEWKTGDTINRMSEPGHRSPWTAPTSRSTGSNGIEYVDNGKHKS
ncbi:unnamed protein product [Heligmosomoides polygyrus]|uniref:REM-1 domain-containing protein n=1 Tax=Heligmosomoides polygyrus TaxID=6339 RepID=A0A3P8ANK7_HELPZ|nr:unnamed protein product [Heligmosomoides polygyrus]